MQKLEQFLERVYCVASSCCFPLSNVFIKIQNTFIPKSCKQFQEWKASQLLVWHARENVSLVELAIGTVSSSNDYEMELNIPMSMFKRDLCPICSVERKTNR